MSAPEKRQGFGGQDVGGCTGAHQGRCRGRNEVWALVLRAMRRCELVLTRKGLSPDVQCRKNSGAVRRRWLEGEPPEPGGSGRLPCRKDKRRQT